MALTRDDAVGRIKRNLGFLGSAIRTTEIQDALLDAQVELERDSYLPWFLRSAVTNLVTIAGTRTVALPAGFLREYEDDALYYLDSDSEFLPLVKDKLDFLHESYGVMAGEPEAYHIGTTDFSIFPLADAVYNLRIIFYKADTVLSSDVTNQWLTETQKLIMGKAGLKVAEQLRDAGAISIFSQMAVEGKAEMIASGEAREHEGQRYIMGGPD